MPADTSAYRWVRRRLILALVLLAAGTGGQMVLGRHVEKWREVENEQLQKPLAQFPDRLGHWVGTELAVDPGMIKGIKIDDYLQRVYVHPSGERLVLWMSYSGRSLDQYHYPTVCMQGSGWVEDEVRRACLSCPSSEAANQETIELDASSTSVSDSRVPVTRMLFNRRQSRQYVYYWYYLIGEDQIDQVMRRFTQVSRVFLRGRRNASLTVEVFSQSAHPDPKLLDEFVKLATVHIDEWMPPGTLAACDLGANY